MPNTGFLLGLWMTRRALRDGFRAAHLSGRNKLARLVGLNGDIMIRSVLLQFLSITAYALDGFAFAAESLVAQAVGVRRLDRVRRAAILTSRWGGAGGGPGGRLLVRGGAIIDLLTTAPRVRTEARAYLP